MSSFHAVSLSPTLFPGHFPSPHPKQRERYWERAQDWYFAHAQNFQKRVKYQSRLQSRFFWSASRTRILATAKNTRSRGNGLNVVAIDDRFCIKFLKTRRRAGSPGFANFLLWLWPGLPNHRSCSTNRVEEKINSGNRSTFWAHFCGVALKLRQISWHVANSLL